MKWFKNCNTLDELKKRYRELVMKYHPDRGGDTRTMQEINLEHDEMFRRLQRENNQRANRHEQGYKVNTEEPSKYRELVYKVLALRGVSVEIIGTWVWISAAQCHAQALKSYGCRWSKSRRLWYWTPYAIPKKDASNIDMDALRQTYGSQRFASSHKQTQGIQPRQ